MLLLDDILLSPFNGILWVANKVHEAAQQELDGEKDNITARLAELYMMLETKQITEEEFGVQEKGLLDRLDELQQREPYLDDEGEQEGTGAAEDGDHEEDQSADDRGE